MKIMNIGDKVLEELEANEDTIDVTRSLLGEYEEFINSSLSHIISLPEKENIFFEVANDDHQSLLQLLSERYLESIEISDPMMDFIRGTVVVQTISYFFKAIFIVVGRVCDPMDIVSIGLTLRDGETIGVRCVYSN